MEQRLTASHTLETLLFNHNQSMNNLQNLVLKLAEAHPNSHLAPPAETLLRDRLDRFVSDYRTPDHPTYSHMIENALKELNEKGGSTKKSISRHLEKKYGNLPWAHSALLKLHLEKACQNDEIIVTRRQKYWLAGSLNSGVKVKKKPRQRKWRWECERKKLKIRLIKKRNDQRGKANDNCDEKEQALTENRDVDETTKSLLSCDDGEKSFHSSPPSILHDGVISAADEKRYSEGENGLSSVAEADTPTPKQDHPEPSTPERPPGFETFRVENLLQLGSTEPDVVDSNEKSKLPAVLQNVLVSELCMVTIDSSEFALSTEQEPKEQPQSQKEEKHLRRSLRTRSTKPRVAQDIAALPPQGCPVTVCRDQGVSWKQRPRSRAPWKPMKATSIEDFPKSQKQRMLLLKQRPEKNLKVVDDCREHESEQSGKLAECTPTHQDLPPDNSKPHLKEQQLGRQPTRRSARLLERR